MNGENVNRKARILVVDDDTDLLELMRLKLARDGFQVDTSHCGERIFDMMCVNQPTLVLLDVQMGSMEGDMICRLLKSSEITAHIPVLMFSGNANVERLTRECGADGYIRKPFDQDIFNRKVDELLGRANPGEA